MSQPTDLSPSEQEPLTANLPTFSQPRQSRRLPPPDRPSLSPNDPTGPTLSPEPSDDSPGSPSEDPTRATPTDGSSPGSTRRPGLLDEGVRKAYEKTAKTVATAASALIDARAGAGTGAFLMVEDEAAEIASPTSRLLARHAPMPGGAGKATDLADGVALVVAVFGYLLAGLARRTAAFTAPTLALVDQDGNPPAEPTPPPAPAPSWPAANRPPAVGLGG